jgi:hypothetical protein
MNSLTCAYVINETLSLSLSKLVPLHKLQERSLKLKLQRIIGSLESAVHFLCLHVSVLVLMWCDRQV